MYERDIGQMISKHADMPHYYGDYVRRLFVAIAVLLLIALPFQPNIFAPFGVEVGLFLIAGLVLLAGATSPRRKTLLYLDLLCAFAGLFFFEYAAVSQYDKEFILVSLVRQSAAILFVFAAYFASKSLRGTLD